MRVLKTNAPAELNYQLQSTNQGDLEVVLEEEGGGGGGGFFQAGNLAIGTVIELSDLSPSPQSATIELAGVEDVANMSRLSVLGRALISLSLDETGSPALSSGTVTLGISWDGVNFNDDAPQSWGGGGNGTSGRLQFPISIFSQAGPATGTPTLRITLAGEPVGGAEAFTIRFEEIVLSALFST